MQCIFRLKRNTDCQNQLLGYEWIEVLAIEPMALVNPGHKNGESLNKTASNWYICNTDQGLVRMLSDDVWAAIEEYKEYRLAT